MSDPPAAPSDQSKGRIVLIGSPSSIFPRHLAAAWSRLGWEVLVVTRRFKGDPDLPGGGRVVAGSGMESPRLRRFLLRLEGLLTRFEKLLVERWARPRYDLAMGLKGRGYHPSFPRALVDALSIARCVKKLEPDLVFGLEAFNNGLATALSKARRRDGGRAPRALMPWGGDIFCFAETSWPAFRMTGWAMRHVDLVCPSSTAAAEHVVHRFGVRPERARGISWGVERAAFPRADAAARQEICRRHGLDPAARIVLNSRRLHSAWGGDVALDAFLRLAQERSDVQFILLGAGTEERPLLDDAKRRIAEAGVEKRFLLFEQQISIEECAEVMSISDIYTSLMHERDMRSSSILQASAAGGAPILTDQPEYHHMANDGFRALFVPSRDPGAVVGAIERYLDDEDLRREIVENNLRYVEEHEDSDRQMRALLEAALGARG